MSKAYSCQNCKRQFRSHSGLWYHNKKCGIIRQSKTHQCPYCDFTCNGPKCTLKNHIYSKHTPEKDRPYQCKICNRGFAQKSHLQKHNKSKHNINYEMSKKTVEKYIITVLDKTPVSKKSQKRMEIYKNNPIIYAKNFPNLLFDNDKFIKPSHISYDTKKGYISVIKK